jgi:hypothetical protein
MNDLVKAQNGDFVADCEATPPHLRPAPPTEEAKANARLIAAAPEFLRALRDLAVWASESPEGRGAWEYVNACAAVSWANGEQYQDIRNTPTTD